MPENKGILITSNFSEIQKWMDLGINPKVEYIPVTISSFRNYEVKSLGFDKVENEYFQSIKDLFPGLKFETVSFHESSIDLSNVLIDVKHLLIGEKSKFNISKNNFKGLEEITFLSIKSFKGKVITQLDTVQKAVLWDSTKTSSLPEMFPNLIKLVINKGALTEVDLRNNKHLEKLEVHYCTKLERILLPDKHKLNEVFIDNCKNLDVNNLPSAVTRVWPPRKETIKKKHSDINLKSTENQHIDSLISNLKKNMEDYMHENDPAYAQNDIDECILIISDYLDGIFDTTSRENAMEIVKKTVLKLNVLNQKCHYSLIETNEREQIAEIIILAGNEMGYNAIDEDITEEWREW